MAKDRVLFKDAFSPFGALLLEAILDEVLGPGKANALADRLARLFPERELMERSRLVTRELLPLLPPETESALQALDMISQRWPSGENASGAEALTGFWQIAFMDAVAELGIGGENAHFERALETLRGMTNRFSAEFAVRPFLIANAPRVLQIMEAWVSDPDPAIRRLVSEGTRPRLPWGVRLTEFVRDPRPVLPLLEALKDDPDSSVRRSVANHLNDISRDNPDLAVEIIRSWYSDDTPARRKTLLKHASRTLLKAGNPEILALFGFPPPEGIQLLSAKVTPERVSPEGEAEALWIVRNDSDAPLRLIVDFRLWMVGAKGKTDRAKIFKGTELALAPGEERDISRRFSFRPVTTRRYYPGAHRIELLVNGREMGEVAFTLSGGN